METQTLATLVGVGATPVVTALVQAVKPFLPEEGKGAGAKWPPLVSVVTGVIWNVGVSAAMGTDLAVGAIVGVTVGLAAAGLYSAGRQVAN
jgi:hypothetical protein